MKPDFIQQLLALKKAAAQKELPLFERQVLKAVDNLSMGRTASEVSFGALREHILNTLGRQVDTDIFLGISNGKKLRSALHTLAKNKLITLTKPYGSVQVSITEAGREFLNTPEAASQEKKNPGRGI